MSRAATGEVTFVRPTNNVYTVLVVVALIVQLMTLFILYTRFSAVFGGMLFTS